MDDFATTVAAATLAEGRSITLPGCGTLSGQRVPARIDHAAKAIAPPSLNVAWATDADPQAPTLADILMSTGADAFEAAQAESELIDALLEGIPLVIGDLGTLKRAVQSEHVRFVPNAAGLETVYWQSGALALEPLDRQVAAFSSEEARPAVGEALVDAEHETTESEASEQSWRAILGMAACILIALGVWAYVGQGDDAQVDDTPRAIAVSQERLNKSPREIASPDEMTAVSEPAVDNAALQPEVTFDPANLAGVAATEDEVVVDEVPVVIVLGSFGTKANANRLAKRLESEGLSPYLDQAGAMTRVGVTFRASDEQQVAAMLQRLRAAYNPSAWVLE